jgi:hypothetical protein
MLAYLLIGMKLKFDSFDNGGHKESDIVLNAGHPKWQSNSETSVIIQNLPWTLDIHLAFQKFLDFTELKGVSYWCIKTYV